MTVTSQVWGNVSNRLAQQWPNALGVKRRLAVTEAHTATRPPTARCPLQLLVGLAAYRCGLTRWTPTRAMEVMSDHSHAITPATGTGSPAHHGVARGPSVLRARRVLPRPSGAPMQQTPDTRHP